ncbi:nitrate ABC transporter substrate-binding protein [Mesotoga sp. Brook.08.105.5.1]|uniref:ABC transporter substrate-binding protein n=1 Tax=Mesotoga sp. Brook.08.105.5.1 TaxID=1421002 RepID=UPI000C1A5FDA|nr:ABC transporter substrate-binding protein [Mesotoga sp. Brook.08.105.5.1]PVD16017.1 nitrate ABC transporter substrate-binding protein [Mesotoga sp. Brook.08.105.5.1]
MRKLVITVFVLSLALVSFGINYMNPVGPTLIPIAELLSSDISNEIPGLEINLWRSVDEAISMLVTGRAQISLLPVTVGVKLAASGVDIKLAAVSMWNGFYFLSTEKSIDDIKDLVGTVIYTLQAPGQTADTILRGALESRGYEVGRDVSIVYVGGAEAVQLLASGKAKLILVPEPFASLAEARVQSVIRSMPIEDLWESFNDRRINIPTSGIFVSGSLDRSVVESFLLLYQQSMSLSLANREKTAEIVSEKMGGFPIPVLQKAMDTAGFLFADSEKAREETTIYIEKLRELDQELTGDIDLDALFF